MNKKCSCRGSNPGPSAHKTEALPTAPQEHAPSGNRTRGTSLATRYFTTKPMALHWMAKRSRRDSNPQPPDSKSGALSIAPRDLSCERNNVNSTDGFDTVPFDVIVPIYTVHMVSWPSGLRRSTQVRVRHAGVGSNPTGTTIFVGWLMLTLINKQ